MSTGSSIGTFTPSIAPSPCPGNVAVSPVTATTSPAFATSAVSNFSPEYFLIWSTFSVILSCISPATYSSFSRTASWPPVTLRNVRRAPRLSRPILYILAAKVDGYSRSRAYIFMPEISSSTPSNLSADPKKHGNTSLSAIASITLSSDTLSVSINSFSIFSLHMASSS